MRRNGITMLVIALLLLVAYGGPATSSASFCTTADAHDGRRRSCAGRGHRSSF